jgi:Tfp pilus assembly protein PilO
MTDIRKWSALAVVLVAAIFAASWFLLISPKRGEAADLKEQAVSQADGNARLEQQLQVLQAQQDDLPRQRARLATLRQQIPDNPALPSLIRDLTAAGRKTGVSIDTMAPATPVALVTPALVAPVAAPAEGTDTAAAGTDTAAAGTDTAAAGTDTAAAGTDTAAGTPVVAAPVRTLYQVPLTLNVSGSYFELEQFLNKVENFQRSFLVSGFTLGGNTGTSDTLTIALTGRVFISAQAAAAPTTTAVVAPAPTTGQ